MTHQELALAKVSDCIVIKQVHIILVQRISGQERAWVNNRMSMRRIIHVSLMSCAIIICDILWLRGSSHAVLNAYRPFGHGRASMELLSRFVLHPDNVEEALIHHEAAVIRIERDGSCVLKAGPTARAVVERSFVLLSLFGGFTLSADVDLLVL